MKCPRCGWISDLPVPECPGCGFSLARLDRTLGQPPAAAGTIDDQAGLLSSGGRARLARRLDELAALTGGELAVATRRTTAPVRPSEYAFWLFNRQGLATRRGGGLLVLLALNEQRIETEVDCEWQEMAGDLETGEALDRHVLPRLKARDYDGALLAAIEALAELVTPAGAKPGPERGES